MPLQGGTTISMLQSIIMSSRPQGSDAQVVDDTGEDTAPGRVPCDEGKGEGEGDGRTPGQAHDGSGSSSSDAEPACIAIGSNCLSQLSDVVRHASLKGEVGMLGVWQVQIVLSDTQTPTASQAVLHLQTWLHFFYQGQSTRQWVT